MSELEFVWFKPWMARILSPGFRSWVHPVRSNPFRETAELSGRELRAAEDHVRVGGALSAAIRVPLSHATNPSSYRRESNSDLTSAGLATLKWSRISTLVRAFN